MLPLPETPRYLVLNNQNDSAGEVLVRLHPGNHVTTDHPDIVHMKRQIESGIELESAGGPFRYRELLNGGKVQNFRRVVLCMAVNVMQQFTGSNMINYYAPVVYQQTMGLSRTLSLILGGCTSMTYLAGSAIPLWVRMPTYLITIKSYFERCTLMDKYRPWTNSAAAHSSCSQHPASVSASASPRSSSLVTPSQPRTAPRPWSSSSRSSSASAGSPSPGFTRPR